MYWRSEPRSAPPAAAPEQVREDPAAEERPEDVLEVRELVGVELEALAAGALGALEAVLVVALALVGVREDRVGLGGLLELLLGLLVPGVLVRVELHGQLAVGLLDLVEGGFFAYAQYFIVVALH